MYKCRRTSVEDIHVLCFNARFYGLWGDGMGQGMAMDSEARCEENQAQKYGTIYAFKTPWYEIETHISHNLNFGFVKLDLKKGPVCKLWRHSLFLDWLCWFYFRPTWNSPWDHCRQYCWLKWAIQNMPKTRTLFLRQFLIVWRWLRTKFQIS